MCPYQALSIVSIGGALYISNKETSNPPVGILKGNDDDGNEVYLKDEDGKYILIDPDFDTPSSDWDLLVDLKETIQGEDAIYINLTNDSDSIITDLNGNIAPGTVYPTTKAQLYKGSVQLISGITWLVSAEGCSATIAPESGTVVTSNMTADKATVAITAIYNSYAYTKLFTFSKLYGADKYMLEPSADVVKYNPNADNGNGLFNPESVTMRAYVIRHGEKQEVTQASNLGFIKFNNETYYSGMTVQTNDLSAFSNGRLSFELYDNSPTPKLSDAEEIPLLQDGENGTDAVTINLTNDTDTICTDSAGNISPDEVYPTTTAQLYYKFQLVDNNDITWNCSAVGCTALISDEGVVTTSNMTANVATVTITGAFMGHSYHKIFTFRKLFGADKFYIQTSADAIVCDKNLNFSPTSITVRAYCKRFGQDPVECTSELGLARIRYAGQLQPQYSPVVVVLEGSSFTDRHLVFALVDNDNNVLDTEDIPLIVDGIDGTDGQPGTDGVDGETPIIISLTNDTDSVITDASGNPLDSLPTTTATLYKGSDILTSADGVVWGTDHVVGCTVNFDQNGVYTVTAMNSDRAQVIIKATYDGNDYLKTFTFSKLYGQEKYVLETSYSTVRYNPDTLTYTPSRLELFAYIIKNGTQTAITQASNLGYIQITGSTDKLYNGASINTADYFGNGGIEICVKDSNDVVKDKEYIQKVSDGHNGTDGEDSIVGWFDNSNIHFICDSDGNVVSGQTYTTKCKLFKGATPVSLDPSSSATGDKVNFTFSISGTNNTEGTLTVTGLNASAELTNDIVVTLVGSNGEGTRVLTVKVNKVVPGKDGESPVVYNVVPSSDVVKKTRENTFTPSVLAVSVRKSYAVDGVIHNDILTPSQASSNEGISIYYKFDSEITDISSADGRLTSNTGITLPTTLTSFVHIVIAKSDNVIIDSQSAGVVRDGSSIVSKGNWDSETAYYEGDFVLFGDGMYRCTSPCTGKAPYGLLKGNGKFLKNANGGYIIASPEAANTDNWELDFVIPQAMNLALDNSSDLILYTPAGSVVSTATTRARLYENSYEVTPDGGFSIESYTSGLSISTSSLSVGIITVTAMSVTSGTVTIKAIHRGGSYRAVFSVKKIVGIDKFEIVAVPNAITYDITLGTVTNGSMRVEVWRTSGTDGARENVSSLSGYGLSLKPYARKTNGTENEISWTSGYSSGYASLTIGSSIASVYDGIVFKLTNGGKTLDAQTAVINRFESNKRFYITVTPTSITKTSAGNSWVSFSSISIKVYKQLGGGAPVAAVNGEVGLFWESSHSSAQQLTITNGGATISSSSISTSATSIRVFITTGGSGSTLLDSQNITIVSNGQQGWAGCQVRVTKWQNQTDSSVWRLTPLNDRNTSQAFGVVDVIAVPYTLGDISGSGTSSAPSSGYYWYAYKGSNRTGGSSNRKVEMTWASERSNHASDWEEMGQQSAMFISLLIAEYGRIEFGTTNEFLIEDGSGNIRAGISGVGGTASGSSLGGVRFWAGSASGSSAPYRVYDSGKLVSSNADITGKITANEGKIGGFIISGDRIGVDNAAGSAGINGMSLYNEFICFNNGDRQAIIGTWSLLGTPMLVRLEDTSSDYVKAAGIMFNIVNAPDGRFDRAFYGNGDGVLNGSVIGYKLNKFIPSSSANTIPLKKGNNVLIMTGSYNIVYLPTLAESRAFLGVDNSVNFAYDLTIMGAQLSSFTLYGYRSSTVGVNCPHIRNNDYGDVTSGIVMAQGDVVVLKIVYDTANYNAFMVSHRN